jgi:hypothetical protein
VGPGDVVVFQLPNWVEAGITFFASAYLNGVYVNLPMMPLLPPDVVWGAFLGASSLIVLATALVHRNKLGK